MTRYNLEMLKIAAKSRKGRLLSASYLPSPKRLQWQCEKGHKFTAIGAAVVSRNKWCRKCNIDNRVESSRLGIAVAQKYAHSNNGKCLSEKYQNSKTPLKWKCKNNHSWSASFEQVKRSKWCSKCRRENFTLRRRTYEFILLTSIAKKRGGQLISSSYVDATKKLKWNCKEGHNWLAAPSSIKKGSWCPQCNKNIINITFLRRIAKQRAGSLISNSYLNSQSPLIWKCKFDHTWIAHANSILNGRWCPSCAKGLNERICRAHFESLFEKKFPNTKPKWLNNTRGNLMELDGYNKTLNLAFEYHGQQHYFKNKFYTKTNRQLALRKKDDARKKRLCKKYGVNLIVIPYSVKPKKLRHFIINQCEKKGLKIKKSSKVILLKDAYSPDRIRELKQLAKINDGNLLSRQYYGANEKLQWQCKKGHIWYATPASIKARHWCHVCSNQVQPTIADMKKIAEKKNGKCLSKLYINNHTKLKWKCNKGHIWFASPSRIKPNKHNDGQWCPTCANMKKGSYSLLTIEEMQMLAQKKGGTMFVEKILGEQNSLILEM